MTTLLEIKKLPDDEYSVVGKEGSFTKTLYSGSALGAVHSIMELGSREGKKYQYQIKNTPLTCGLINQYGGSDKKNLLSDLQGEYKAIKDYDLHIVQTSNPAIGEKLQEIRDEEEHHSRELKELLAKEV